MGSRAVAARDISPSPNKRMELTGAHPAQRGHQRLQRAGSSSAVVELNRSAVVTTPLPYRWLPPIDTFPVNHCFVPGTAACCSR
jgi:hypothetical protein